MSILNPGFDAGHVKKLALSAKNLGTLSREEDSYQRMKNVSVPIVSATEYNPFKAPAYNKTTIEEIKEYCKGKSADEIHQAMGREVSYLKNGKKILNGGYGWKNPAYSFKIAGIDEKELLKDVVAIHGNCSLIGSELENLGEVESITGRLIVPYFTKLKDLSSIKTVGSVEITTEEAGDMVKLLKKLNFNPKTIWFEGTPYSTSLLSLKTLNGIETAALQTLKSLAASKIY